MADQRNQTNLLYRGENLLVWSHECAGRDTGDGMLETARGFELAFTRFGVYRVTIGRVERVVHASHILAFQPGDEYRVRHPVGGADASTVISLRPEALAEILAETGPAHADGDPARLRFPYREALATGRLAILHMDLLRTLRDRPSDGPGIESAALHLAGLALRSTEPAPRLRAATRADYAERVRHLQTFLYARRAEPLRLSDLAREAAFSPYHLTRVWRAMTGTTLHAYLSSARLREALGLLAEGAEDLTELALRLGFASHSHFSERFRREFGVAPSAFRDRHRPAAPRPVKTARS